MPTTRFPIHLQCSDPPSSHTSYPNSSQQAICHEITSQTAPLAQGNGIQNMQGSSTPAQSSTPSQQAVACRSRETALQCPYCNKVDGTIRDDLRCISCRIRLDSRLTSPESRREAEPSLLVKCLGSLPRSTRDGVTKKVVRLSLNSLNDRPTPASTTARSQRSLKDRSQPRIPLTPRPVVSRGYTSSLRIIEWAPQDERSSDQKNSIPTLSSLFSSTKSPHCSQPSIYGNIFTPTWPSSPPSSQPSTSGSSFTPTRPSIPPAHPACPSQCERPILRRNPERRGEGVQIGNSYPGFYESKYVFQ